MKFKDWLLDVEYTLLQGNLDVEVNDVIYDSRKAEKEKVFVCIQGSRVDSHDFIEDVSQKGCSVFVIEREVEHLPADAVVIKVEDARKALALISAARFGHPSEKMITIGVTGTKGKTTTAHMIKSILEASGKKAGMIGTNGVVIGNEHFKTVNTTPESYVLQEYFSKMVEQGCEYMIMEVSSQGVKLNRIAGISFDYGLFLNISPDHIGPDEHADFEEYLYYKSEFLNRCRIGIVNQDDEHFNQIIAEKHCDLYSFSMNGSADFNAKDLHFVSENGFVGIEFLVDGKYTADIRVGIPGRFNASNALAAVSVCSFLKLPEDKISHGLEHIKVNGRMEIVHASEKCTVIVDYAHNAVSMESLLKTLREYHPKRLVCVFGCGGNRSKDRRYSMGEIGGKLADLCIITADNSRFEKVEDIIADIRSSIDQTGGAYIEIPDRREAIEYSIKNCQPGDMIAVIGKGHEDYQEINGVRHHFLDREVIEETFAEL